MPPSLRNDAGRPFVAPYPGATSRQPDIERILQALIRLGIPADPVRADLERSLQMALYRCQRTCHGPGSVPVRDALRAPASVTPIRR